MEPITNRQFLAERDEGIGLFFIQLGTELIKMSKKFSKPGSQITTRHLLTSNLLAEAMEKWHRDVDLLLVQDQAS